MCADAYLCCMHAEARDQPQMFIRISVWLVFLGQKDSPWPSAADLGRLVTVSGGDPPGPTSPVSGLRA